MVRDTRRCRHDWRGSPSSSTCPPCLTRRCASGSWRTPITKCSAAKNSCAVNGHSTDPQRLAGTSAWGGKAGDLLQESLHLATCSGTAKPANFTCIIVSISPCSRKRLPSQPMRSCCSMCVSVWWNWHTSTASRCANPMLGSISSLIRHRRYAHAKQFKLPTGRGRRNVAYLSRAGPTHGARLSNRTARRRRECRPRL